MQEDLELENDQLAKDLEDKQKEMNDALEEKVILVINANTLTFQLITSHFFYFMQDDELDKLKQ